MPTGRVILVGAGPGDPDLITVKGLRALEQADVVVYDRLAPQALLDLAKPGAERIDVGKRPNDPLQVKQEEINQILIDKASTGALVIRLKGGDPFVYGRGGEEVLALTGAGIPVEVIPGVSSAIAAPAAAGIPVTHRKVSNAFAVFSGHEAAGAEGDTIVWHAAASIPTAVFLMGVERLPEIVSSLLAHKRDPCTPVALVASGTLPNQRVVRSTLCHIVEDANGVEPPAVLVVGDVVNVLEAG